MKTDRLETFYLLVAGRARLWAAVDMLFHARSDIGPAGFPELEQKLVQASAAISEVIDAISTPISEAFDETDDG